MTTAARLNPLLALLPLVLLAGLLGFIVWSGPADAVRGDGFPPVERLTFQRVSLEPGFIVATVFNDGPDDVAIAQVQVDDAFWTFTADNGQTLGHLGRTTLRIPYPWVEGEAHVVRVLTSTGTPFDHEIAVAVETPTANGRFLESDKAPSRALGGIDNRGSHFYLAMYWARALADQTKNEPLRARFGKVAAALQANEQKIVAELIGVQGKPVDIGGYYHPNPQLTSQAMRPSATLNTILAAV